MFVLKEKDEASAADDLMDLTGLLKTIDDSVVELKGYNNKIYELIAEDAEVEKEMDDDMTLKMKINKFNTNTYIVCMGIHDNIYVVHAL